MNIIIYSVAVLIFAFAGGAFFAWRKKHHPEDSEDSGPSGH